MYLKPSIWIGTDPSDPSKTAVTVDMYALPAEGGVGEIQLVGHTNAYLDLDLRSVPDDAPLRTTAKILVAAACLLDYSAVKTTIVEVHDEMNLLK